MSNTVKIPRAFLSRGDAMTFFNAHKLQFTPAQKERVVAMHDALPVSSIHDPVLVDAEIVRAKFQAAWDKAKAHTNNPEERGRHMAAAVATLLGNGSVQYAQGVGALYTRHGMKLTNQVAMAWCRRPLEAQERFRGFRKEVEAWSAKKSGEKSPKNTEKVA